MQEKNNEEVPQVPGKGFEIPKDYRTFITIISSLFSVGIVLIYLYLIFFNPDHLDPEKFGLSTLLIFSVTLLAAINIPWKKLGLRIKKIGIIELEEMVEGQARNVNKDIANLQLKIEEIEKKVG